MPELEHPRSAVTGPNRPGSETAAARAERDDRWLEDELDFGRYLGVFRRHSLLMVAGALIGALAGLAIGMTRVARYEAVTTLIAHLPTRAGTGGVDRATLRAFIENQTLATEVLQELGLDKPPHGLTPQRFAAEALRVEEQAGTNLFRVRVQLADPAMAAEASRRLAQRAVALNKQVAGGAGELLRNELKPHLSEAAGRLKATEQQLVSYQREAQIELLQADTDAMVGERGELLRLLLDIEGERARIATAEEQLRKQQPMLAAGRQPEAEDALRHAASVEAEAYRARQPARRGEPASPGDEAGRRSDARPRERVEDPGRGESTATAGDRRLEPTREEHTGQGEPAVPRAAETGEVDPRSLDLSNPFVNPVYQTLQFQLATSRARLAALERHRLALVRRVGGPELKELTNLYQRQVDLERRQSEYELARRIFAEVSLRYERASTDPLGNSAYLQVIDEAVQPDRPMPRKRVQTVALGLLCGLLAAAVVAVLRDSGAVSGRRVPA